MELQAWHFVIAVLVLFVMVASLVLSISNSLNAKYLTIEGRHERLRQDHTAHVKEVARDLMPRKEATENLRRLEKHIDTRLDDITLLIKSKL